MSTNAVQPPDEGVAQVTYEDDGPGAERDTAIVPTHRPDAAAAGWYPDPWASRSRRYWNGTQWTSLTFADRDAGDEAGAAARAGERDPFGVHPAPPQQPATPPAWVRPDRPPAPQAPVVEFPDGGAAPPGPRRSWAVLLTALAVVLALALIGTFVATRRPAPTPVAAPTPAPSAPTAPTPTPTPSAPTPTPTSPPSSPPSAAPGAPAPVSPGDLAALARLGLRQSDVVLPVMVLPIDGGTQVAGQKTLDLCDGSYPSEALRQARVQVAGYEPDGTPRLSTETVRYQSSGSVDQAWTEIQRVAASCSTTAPGTTLGARPDTTWPSVAGVRRLAYDVTSTDATGTPTHYVVVYLSRGNILMGVYFPTPRGTQISVTGKDTIPGIVSVFEKRLAQIPPSGLSGGPGGLGGGGGSGGGQTA